MQEAYKEIADKMHFTKTVKDRVRLGMRDYESLHTGNLGPEYSIRKKLGVRLHEGREFVLKDVNKSKDFLGQRTYMLA